MYKYRHFKERKNNEQIGGYFSYGICTVDGSKYVSDVSLNESVAVEIARKLNEGKVSYIHMEDVIYDELH